MEYELLTEGDKALLARDRLRGLESDHYRLSLTAREGDGSYDQLARLEEQIAEVKAALPEGALSPTQPPTTDATNPRGLARPPDPDTPIEAGDAGEEPLSDTEAELTQ